MAKGATNADSFQKQEYVESPAATAVFMVDVTSA